MESQALRLQVERVEDSLRRIIKLLEKLIEIQDAIERGRS